MKRSRPPAAPVPEVRFRDPVPVTGPYADFLQQQQANRAVLTGVVDLRSHARTRVDNVWDGAKASCLEKFGRALPLEVWEQASDHAVMALNHARDCESNYLRLAGAGASPASVERAFDEFCSATASWLNVVTRGWPSAKAYEKQLAREYEADWRRP